MTSAGTDTLARVHEVAVELLPRAVDLGTEVAAHIATRLPEFGIGEAGELVVATCRANCTAIIDGLARNVPMHAVAPTFEVRQLTRALVQHGLELAAVMRAYRVGAHLLTEKWAAAVQRRVGTDQDAVAVAQAGTRFVFGWLDEISERVAEEYLEEAERLARERSLAHVEDVHRALTDPDVDVPAASARLGYNLGGRHVALVLRHESGGTGGSGGSGGSDVGAAARRLAGAIGGGPPLTVRVDLRTTWCWVPCGSDTPRIPGSLVPGSLVAACGRAGRGLAGFRESHREALAALRVAELAERGPGTLVRYDQEAVAVLCSADPEWCRAFVVGELGALAVNDEPTRRIRATLEEFFAANSNFRATAARLGVHHNTVRYRLERAEQLLGGPPGQRRLALELALHLVSRLGPWVLVPSPRATE